MCLGGVCANTEGSYTCTRCKAGYRVSQDRQRCEGKFQPCSSLTKRHYLLFLALKKNLLNTSAPLANSPLKFPCCATEFPLCGLLNIYSDAHACLCWHVCMSLTQILMSVSPFLPVPTGSASTRKAPTLARTAQRGTGYRTMGSSAKVGLSTAQFMNSCKTPHVCLIQLEKISTGAVLDCYYGAGSVFLGCRGSECLTSAFFHYRY